MEDQWLYRPNPARRARQRTRPLDLTLNQSLRTATSSRSPSGAARRLRADRPPLSRLRAPEGLVVLHARRRLRGSDPGGARRPLQGDPRLPHRPRVELPQLRRALHHPPDHHRRQDGEPQQARAAQPIRVLRAVAGRVGGRRDDARGGAPRARSPRSRPSARSPARSSRRWSLASRASSPSSRAASSPCTSTATRTSRSASASSATRRRSTTPSSASSARSPRTSPAARCSSSRYDLASLARIAQLAEHAICNREAVGSIPTPGL